MASSEPRKGEPAGRTRRSRIWYYLSQMLAPGIMIPYLICHGAAVYLGLAAAQGQKSLRLDWQGVSAIASIVLFVFLLRAFDDIKDAEADIRLGKAGDPRYAGRPLVTGAVTLADISLLRWVLTGLLFALNLPFVGTVGFVGFCVAYLCCWLSFRWFFWPRVRKSLLLAFVTHNPLLLVLLIYLVTMSLSSGGWGGLTPKMLLLLVGAWLPWTAWETSRKIRVPGDETDYQTYSKIFGRAAPLVPSVFVLGSFAALTAFAVKAGLGWMLALVLLAPTALFVSRALLFWIAPTSARSRLQPYADLYSISANAGLLAVLAAKLGLTWG